MQTRLTVVLSLVTGLLPSVLVHDGAGSYATFTKGDLCPAFRQKTGGQRNFPVYDDSQLPLIEIIVVPKWHIWGQQNLDPFSIFLLLPKTSVSLYLNDGIDQCSAKLSA